jgi:translation initiation factor 2 beta subunit (eIF-2beta)/eIF-5
MLREITAASDSKFEQDVGYLNKLFGTTSNIKACVLRISGKKGSESYSQKFADPKSNRRLDLDKTLRISNLTDVVLFYKHDVDYLPTIEMCDGVTMEKSFSFTKGYKVESYWYKPAKLPDYLEDFIVQCMTKAFENFKIKPDQRLDDFFETNFKRGGMMPIKAMKRHPEWQTQYIGQVNLKDFNMCKSCKQRALSGCCPEYSALNRIKVRMVLGWHQDEDA